MTYALSRLMSTATASYGAYALADPAHLGRAMGVEGKDRAGYDLLSQTFGIRDLALSSVGIFGRSPGAVKAAMKVRIMLDVGDGLLLATKARDEQTRQKVLGVTMGWAALNLVALAIDSRRAKA
ncbi:hypothetical protein [Nocardioides donggukensis]|uniref:Uncharacterized protein n=1 Tax=Nocardioides donggukensis TaxID=2774019 RepID=A0A927K5J9_9ACTN|nr:hypothetical protein [Nocardioides donggukensis]MBD8868120.1 hypothetical protein [Nocardioides donggukensis]